MKSWFPSLLFPSADKRQQPADEEEGTALVLPPAGDQDDHVNGAPLCKDDIVVAAPAVERQSSSTTNNKPWTSSLLSPARGAVGLVIGGLVFLALLAGTRWIDLDASSFLMGNGGRSSSLVSGSGRRRPHHTRSPSTAPLIPPIPFNCGNETATCRRHRQSPAPSPSVWIGGRGGQSPPSCPDYFRHIHSDLDPWRGAGITREAVERGRPHAHFRLVVVGGRAYVETYHRAFQTRDVFTQWGILQLLARYPGRVPDLDLMFNCEDMPEVRAAAYPSPSAAPPLFRYCNDATTLDILFPDWSFWGWPEVNIRPWAPLMEEVARENARLPWPEREPYAYWKGNPDVSAARGDLLRCNTSSSSGKADWNARVFRQDWGRANRNGFRESNLAKQCHYRYKIYVQGRSWSVSEKYILACDSPMLAIETPYRDFFSRGLVPGRHYWPIDAAHKCRSIKFAVDWGNAHPALARRMAEEGSSFAGEDMSMDYVYDYMLHVLTQYAALLRYRPAVPEKAVELCLESMVCPARGRDREFMMESRERYVADYDPCTLPAPFTAEEARQMADRDRQVRNRVHEMEEKS